MCIACELGYLSMIDALEAERNASKKKAARTADGDFGCDAPVAQPARKRRRRAARPPEEPAP
jgi:hypothetical protein